MRDKTRSRKKIEKISEKWTNSNEKRQPNTGKHFRTKKDTDQKHYNPQFSRNTPVIPAQYLIAQTNRSITALKMQLL